MYADDNFLTYAGDNVDSYKIEQPVFWPTQTMT